MEVRRSIAANSAGANSLTQWTSVGSAYRPANALHAVLERVTAEHLRDKAVDVEFDASYVIFIATANRLGRVESTLLSRFEIFHIEGPDARAAVAIARSIGQAVLRRLKLSKRFSTPTGEVLQQLALLGSPRRMTIALEAGSGRAILAGRNRVVLSDLLPRAGDQPAQERFQ